ncbi:DNA-binding NarL/FixJ family response regulator [Arthrobacter stackebrandtii]|uniref:DNA-binding NarL/FixJ family response regulator n=1 Tax=Arthrobacter stackebrandtii TaxID=272161 RepID=A0ABS4YSB9_9MICC|nr:response regulator transcription factor [Arthrobacter stackebrandtii]MBP2411684.1 DNA-binding NarL/FixJ family response regulator [Arthrobacter stackebrandtii]PYG99672.1 DNA-binding response regulator [Arthrobacter stackebrandtii]
MNTPDTRIEAPEPPPAPITVLIADDHAAIRLGMRMVVDTAPDMEVVGEAGDGATAVGMARTLRPDVVLMDLRMPVLDGVGATEAIRAEGLARVLVLTTFDHDSYLYGALRAGADGFLLKSAEPEAITQALRRVHRGEQVIAPEVTARIVAAALAGGGGPAPDVSEPAGLAQLTEREREVFDCLGDGLTNYSIGRRLGISEATVKTHVSRVLGKLGLQSRVQAALYRHG